MIGSGRQNQKFRSCKQPLNGIQKKSHAHQARVTPCLVYILASVLTPVIQEFVRFNSGVSVTVTTMTQLPIPHSLLFFSPQNFYWKFLYLLSSSSSLSLFSFSLLCFEHHFIKYFFQISLNISFKLQFSLPVA